MSENHPEPDLPESDAELDSLLKKLQPNPLEFEKVRELEAELEIVFADSSPSPNGCDLRWHRLIPLALVGALGMLAYASFQYEAQVAAPVDEAVVEAATSVRPPSMVSSLETGSFQPVSAQGYLINSSSGGLIETEEGLREKRNLEYRDAYHWHDPETGTSIRYFRPRSEEVIIPLQTD